MRRVIQISFAVGVAAAALTLFAATRHHKQSLRGGDLVAAEEAAITASHGFPEDNSGHASCSLTVVLAKTSCSDAKAEAKELIATNVDVGNENEEFKGQYSIFDQGDDWIWSTRLTYDKQYTDDQLYEFSASSSSPSSCQVQMSSRSQSSSYLDYSVNYCNMWNVVSRITGYDSTSPATTDPSVVASCNAQQNLPTDPVTVCARY